MEAQEQLRITWAHGAEFLSALDRDAGRYTVEVPHSSRVLRQTTVGGQLLVEHQFIDRDRAFRHVARVVGYEAGPPEVFTLEFVEAEHRVRDLVICHAEGQSVPYLNRRAERRPVWLPIQFGERSLHGIVTELSELGAFVTTNHPAPEGSVELRFPAMTAGLAITARVLYTRGGHDRGFAVEFVFADRNAELRVQAVLHNALRQANQRK